MLDEKDLLRQLEVYSNSIVAFHVVQGFSYSYHFGGTEFFNNLVKSNQLLSLILCGVFLFTIVGGVFVNHLIYRKLSSYWEGEGLLSNVYWVKSFVIVFMGMMPLGFTLGYADPFRLLSG